LASPGADRTPARIGSDALGVIASAGTRLDRAGVAARGGIDRFYVTVTYRLCDNPRCQRRRLAAKGHGGAL